MNLFGYVARTAALGIGGLYTHELFEPKYCIVRMQAEATCLTSQGSSVLLLSMRGIHWLGSQSFSRRLGE